MEHITSPTLMQSLREESKRCLTVGQLIDELSKYDRSLPVFGESSDYVTYQTKDVELIPYKEIHTFSGCVEHVRINNHDY